MILKKIESAFPIAIGTSYVFESIFAGRTQTYDPDRVIPNKVNISDYKEMWINVATVFRNVISSLSEENTLEKCNLDDLYDTLLFELMTIDSILKIEGGGICRCVFYLSRYNKITQSIGKSPLIKIRGINTDKQKYYFTVYDAFIKKLTEDKSFQFNLKIFDDTILPDKKVKVLLLSHIPYDLLSANKFDGVSLIESNTGILKKSIQWNSKYYKMMNESLSHLPFNLLLLLIFGDSVHFSPMSPKIRKKILDLSLKYKWNTTTSIHRILLNFRLENDPDLFILSSLNLL